MRIETRTPLKTAVEWSWPLLLAYIRLPLVLAGSGIAILAYRLAGYPVGVAAGQVWSTLTLTVINLLCLWLLVPAFGIMGAALSVCVTRVLVVLLGLYCSQLVYPIQYEWARCLKIGVVFLALSIAASLQLSDNPYLSALMKMPVVLAYPIALFALNFFSPQEIGFVLKIPARMISAGEVRRNIS